jgi:Pyruvate/2-oxoacid:ferredoxin oxidoreductase gamma subunit
MGLNDLPQDNSTTIYQASIRQLADKLGHVRYMGIASLGALAAIDDRVELALLEKTIKTDNKLRRFKKENLKALHGGAVAVTIHKS